MKGTNTLTLNPATLRQALELYLDHIFNSEHETYEVVAAKTSGFECLVVEFKAKTKDVVPFETKTK